MPLKIRSFLLSVHTARPAINPAPSSNPMTSPRNPRLRPAPVVIMTRAGKLQRDGRIAGVRLQDLPLAGR